MYMNTTDNNNPVKRVLKSHFSLFPLFLKDKSRLMKSLCSLCVCLYVYPLLQASEYVNESLRNFVRIS
jgi:hypothetical protein